MTTDSQTPPSSLSVFGVDPYIVRYGSIFLLLVGTFGNVLSFIIFTQGTLRRSSTFRYLALLSLMDLLVLYSGLLDLLLTIEYQGAFSLRNLNQVTCRLHTFITYWSQHSSSWILSFISVDRAVATNCIQFARKFCTPRSAEYIVASIIVITALLNCHELAFLRLQDVDPIEVNTNIDEYTTLSPLRRNFYTESSFISSDITLNNKPKRQSGSKFLFASICDNSRWNFLCPRNKRDLPSLSSLSNQFFYPALPTSVPNVTTNRLRFDSSTISSTIRHCAASKGSPYEYFWDYVWEWIDVCLYAFIPFTIMIIGTFLIVYRVYYQQRRVFRSRHSIQNNLTGAAATPNKAKSLFYLLFTLNLLYFVLVSPVVLVTTLSRDQNEEHAHPRFKAIIYLMQYCNHSLNFVFYGITSPPYRRTLWEWLEIITPRLPQCCQRTIRRRSQTFQTRTPRFQSNIPQQVRVSIKKDQQILMTTLNETNIPEMTYKTSLKKESIALLPR